MNAMSSVALGDSVALKAQYEALQAEMAKIQRAMSAEPVEMEADVLELTPAQRKPAVRVATERKVPSWLLQVAEDAPKNQIEIGRWGPAV